jgi:hypothetical protein
MTGPVAALVDAYTAGQYLPPAFRALGASLVHVQSTPQLIASMGVPDFSVYDELIVNEDPERTAARLARLPVTCVVAGMEPGVLLADTLSDALGLPTNGAARASLRRDKHAMTEALRAAGLRCARQFKSDDPDAILAWADREGPYPYVVKPTDSAATDSVFICHTPGELDKAAREVRDRTTIFGKQNDEVLVQTFLEGTEYVIDMVSYAGSRYVCGVWRYDKRFADGSHPIYDTERLLSDDDPVVRELVDYTDAALAALGVRFGPSHAEVMLTPDGPALVEVGTRMAGNMHPGFHDQCAGANQADLTALAFLRPADFLRSYGGRTYRKRKEAICYLTPTALNGVVTGIDEAVVAEISALKTVYTLNVKKKVGDRLRPTVDLFSSTLRVFMRAADDDDIAADYRRVQELADRVYIVSSPAEGIDD